MIESKQIPTPIKYIEFLKREADYYYEKGRLIKFMNASRNMKMMDEAMRRSSRYHITRLDKNEGE